MQINNKREARQEDPAQDLRLKVKELGTRILKMMGLAAQMENPTPALRETEKLEESRKGITAEIVGLDASIQQLQCWAISPRLM